MKLSLKKKRRTKSTTQPDYGTGKKKKVGGRWGQDVHKLAHVRRHAEAESRKKKREQKYASLCESKPTQRTVLQDKKERREEEEKRGEKKLM